MSDSGFQQSGLSDIQQRLVFLKVGVLVVISLLTLRLWQLQVRDGPHYLELSQDNRTRSILLHPARGLIYDRNGKLLANNVPSFNLYVELKDVKDRKTLIEKLVEYLDIEASEVSETIRTRSSRTRIKLKGGLTLREAALIESHRLTLPGVVVQPEFQRNNPQGPYAAHVVGYVGEVSERQMSKKYFEGLHQGSIVGQYGVEREYDQLLRGQAGSKLIEVDALGHEKRTISVDKPQAGHDLYLTIDFDLQRLAEDLLGVEAGAIVALDPKTGETLALASRPSFDPNTLSRGLRSKDWQKILQDKRHPLTNRAIQGLYPPGSTFKIIMAAAALETNTVDISDTIQCNGRFRFGRRTYRDWKASGHGTVDLHKAMMQSCDVYFYKMGHRLGIDTIATYAKLFGLGKKTGIDLPSEHPGIAPSPEWKQKARGEPWYPGETISVSIGQGFVTTTPIQMAQVIATIGNNGVAHQPRLIRGVRHRSTGQIETWPTPPATPLGLKPAFVEGIQRSLASVVSEGTARRANSPLVTIAGKTGTSQVVALRPDKEKDTPKEFRDHAWFVSYAPFDNPQIAVAVLAEHSGHGGSAAAPLARELIEAFIKKNGNVNPVGESPLSRENTKRPVL